MEQPYSKREQDILYQELFKRLDNQDKVLDEIKTDGKETKAQAQKTNGRVTALESWSLDAKKVIEASAKMINAINLDYQKSKTRVYTTLSIFVLLGAAMTSGAVLLAKYFIRQQVQSGFAVIEKKYDIQVDNNN